MLTPTTDGQEEACCCSEDLLLALQASSPKVQVPTAPDSIDVAQELPPTAFPTGRCYRLGFSGTDPPYTGDMRLHLRWQVFLI